MPTQIEASTVKVLIFSGMISEAADALVQELTGRVAAEGLSMRVQGEPVVRGVSRERGQELAASFAAAGCEVQLIDEPRHRIGYDPRHPLRGDQPLRRLRWLDDALALDHGTLSCWALGELERLGSSEALALAVVRECEAWMREGLAIATDERSLIEALSARELRLEAEIRAAEDLGAAAGVYTDWLQSQGDPRGWLVSVEPELLERHASHLFGSAAWLLSALELEWCGGVLVGLSNEKQPNGVGRGTWRDIDALFELLGLPLCACLRSLRVGAGKLVSRDVELRLASVDPRVREGLRAFALRTYVGDSFGRCELLPNLEALELTVPLSRPLRFDRLRELSVRVWSTDSAAAALRESSLPGLHSVTLRVESMAWSGIDTLLSCPALLTVRSLRLEDPSADGHPVWTEHGPELLTRLLRAPLIERLERLDLRGIRWTPEGLEAIAAARERLPSETLVGRWDEIDEGEGEA